MGHTPLPLIACPLMIPKQYYNCGCGLLLFSSILPLLFYCDSPPIKLTLSSSFPIFASVRPSGKEIFWVWTNAGKNYTCHILIHIIKFIMLHFIMFMSHILSREMYTSHIPGGGSGTNCRTQGGVYGCLSDPQISLYSVLSEVVSKKNFRNQLGTGTKIADKWLKNVQKYHL